MPPTKVNMCIVRLNVPNGSLQSNWVTECSYRRTEGDIQPLHQLDNFAYTLPAEKGPTAQVLTVTIIESYWFCVGGSPCFR